MMVKPEIKFDFDDVDQDILLFCAFRYALGRRSYVVGTIVDIIIANWEHMPTSRREMFQRDIREAIETDRCGSKYDIERWERILRLTTDDTI